MTHGPSRVAATSWSRKRDAWRELDLTVVAPSRWLTRCARSSSLLQGCRVETIPNGLDLGRYGALDQRSARASLGLPLHKKLVAFGAHGGTTDSNKGFSRLAAALRALRDHPVGKDMELVVFGAGAPPAAAEVSCKATYLGWLSDDTTLNRVYAAADVVVVPSLLENLPFAVMEAMASGTPTVAFRQGGVPDLVDHLENGYLAEPYDLGDLAKGIAWVLAAPSERVRASARAKVASAFNARDMAERYADLYREVIASRGRASPCGS